MDITNNNFGELKQAILNILKDSQIHNIDEITAYVNNNLAPRVISKNHIYTAISQLSSHGINIEKLTTGTYCLKKDESNVIQNVHTVLTKQLTESINYLKKELSYDLSSYEYLHLKELNDKLQALINEIYDN